MNELAAMLNRIPRFVLFAVAGLIQVALVAVMVFDRIRILRTGTEVTLQTRPVDPRDFLRGDYVTLFYDISSLPAGALKDTPVAGRGIPIYVKLAPGPDGIARAVSLHLEPVAVSGNEVLIAGRLNSGFHCGTLGNRTLCDRLGIKYGIESYFVPEGEGRAIESARNEGKVTVVAAVAPGGRAAIKRLLIDGKPVYDEPMF
jgi:uncharacterized membrane-anchored protein